MRPPADLASELLSWWLGAKRSLPWRGSGDPYAVWVSEIMLQQTRAGRAAEYFQRWMKRFPDLHSLARAEEEEVLRLFEGLGYYSRARNMLRAAKMLVRERDGEFPAEKRDLEKLPGIGPYTAAAVSSMAFGRDEAAVDANVERIMARLYDVNEPLAESATKTLLRGKAESLLPPGRAGDFNQGLMDLGATVCLPRAPRCGKCPLSGRCLAFRAGTAADRPVRRRAAKISKVEIATGVLGVNGRFFVQKRPDGGVWAGLWEFPGGRLEPGETPREAVVREFAEETGFEVVAAEKIGVIRHSYTRYRVTMHCFFVRAPSADAQPELNAAVEYKWASVRELAGLPFPAPQRELVRLAAGADKKSRR
jgi:A/G-specific adenine glycosylase